MLDSLMVQRFVNQLMTSNCYIIHNTISRSCIIIDPGSEKSKNEIKYIEDNKLHPEYIILTHEHTDHNWGVNSLRDQYKEIKLICTVDCEQNISKTNKSYFLFYYNNKDYDYIIEPADLLITKQTDYLYWETQQICFIYTPGHTCGSMCILIENMIFTGDTFMQYKSYIPKNKGSKKDFDNSIKLLEQIFEENNDFVIYPGHGNEFKVIDLKKI